MARKCEKCLKKYDDTWGVCLFCGSKLKGEEERRHVYEGEPEKDALKKGELQALFLTLLIGICIIGIFFLIYLTGAGYFDRLQQSLYESGRFPNVRFVKP